MNALKIIFAAILASALAPLALAHAANERAYQNAFASRIAAAQTEVVAANGTRCDILTPTHAIEVDFASKWAEAIGQALNYAMQFNRRGGIVLIIETPADNRYAEICASVIARYALPIDLFKISPQEISTPAK